MGKQGPTDVLSFPMDDEPIEGVPTLLGDIVISPSVAAEQCAEHAGTIDDELALLVVHGILHVLGHDHREPAETTVMRAENSTSSNDSTGTVRRRPTSARRTTETPRSIVRQG